MRRDVQILDKALNVEACSQFVEDSAAGGSCIFVGTVRNATQGRNVVRLEFESFIPMAVKEIDKILDLTLSKWRPLSVSVHHRVGKLEIGEAAVIIAVSTPHREAAFNSCKFIIDTLKQTVPIWKKEIFEDGQVWVAAHP